MPMRRAASWVLSHSISSADMGCHGTTILLVLGEANWEADRATNDARRALYPALEGHRRGADRARRPDEGTRHALSCLSRYSDTTRCTSTMHDGTPQASYAMDAA